MLIRLDHVQVSCPADAEPGMRAFYLTLLGMEELAKPPILAARGGFWCRAGAAELHVGLEEDFRPARKAHPAFAVDEIDALTTRLTAADRPVTWDDAIPGVRRFYVSDPAGNRLEFLQG